MELSDIEVKPDHLGSFEASQRGDMTWGDGGYTVIVSAWGSTEEEARANLAKALSEVVKTPER